MAQLNIFALITLIVVIMVIIFLVLTVVYFYRVWHLQPPSIGEATALFWTGIVFIIMYVILAIYCLWHLFSYTEKVVGEPVSSSSSYPVAISVPVQYPPAPMYSSCPPPIAPAYPINVQPVNIQPLNLQPLNVEPVPSYNYPRMVAREAAITVPPVIPVPQPLPRNTAVPGQAINRSSQAFSGNFANAPVLTTSLSNPPQLAPIRPPMQGPRPTMQGPVGVRDVNIPQPYSPIVITSQPPKLVPIST